MQLLLPVTINSTQTFSSFVGADAEQIMAAEIQRVIGEDKFAGVYISGKEGQGKSHLLSAACHFSNDKALTSMMLPMEQVKATSPDIIQGLENVDLLCVDNLDAIAGELKWETAIFNLFNALMQNNAKVIFTASATSNHIDWALPDLASRLQWCTYFQLSSLSERDKQRALVQHAHLMGFELSDDVVRFMLNRLPRKMSFLMSALDQLAKQSIAQQRKITVPFVKEVLEV